MPRVFEKPPECNIGTAGHVDHGKCLALEEFIITNRGVLTGKDLRKLVQEVECRTSFNGGLLYDLRDLTVITFSEDMRLKPSNAAIYLQPYKGVMIKVRTKKGRTVTVTPNHPLMVFRGNEAKWVSAHSLKVGDRLAIIRKLRAPEVPFKPFNDLALRELKKNYICLTRRDYLELKLKTGCFRKFSSCDLEDFKKLLILHNLSLRGLASKINSDYAHLRKVFKCKRRLTSRVLERLIRFFKRLGPPKAIEEYEVLITYRNNSAGRFHRFKLVKSVDESVVRWLSFIHAEGTSSLKGRLSVFQSKELKMLKEFLRITEDKFNLSFRYAGKSGWHLNSKPFIDYLVIAFDFKPGNSRQSRICPWIALLPRGLKAEFLRWFFTLEGHFNRKTGQITLSQANKHNIAIIAYMLLSFGIFPSLGVRKIRLHKGYGEYYRLSISGRGNLATFLKEIGFENPEKNKLVKKYLSSICSDGKRTELMVYLDVGKTSAYLEALKPLGLHSLQHLKRGKLTLNRIHGLTLKLKDEISRLNELSRQFSDRLGLNLLRLASAIGLSQSSLSRELGISRKKLRRSLAVGDEEVIKKLSSLLKIYYDDALTKLKGLFHELKKLDESDILFDRIIEVSRLPYDGYVIDLTVPNYRNFVAGFGGIICHNTTLVEALTGVWTSRHSEELKRGITIRLGYADAGFYRCPVCPPPRCYSTKPVCPHCGSKTELLRVVSFVDAPGHEILMATMLSGAAVMDGAILVIAADEPCPQPQTREHLAALEIIGVKNIVIVQNKIELVSPQEAMENYRQIKRFIEGTVVEGAPIIPMSAQHRVNVDYLIEALEKYIPTPKRDPSKPPLMYVVRSFDINRPGTRPADLHGGVVGGSIVQGSLKVGDEIEIRPGLIFTEKGVTRNQPLTTRIVSLRHGGRNVKEARCGGLVGVGTCLDPSLTKADRLAGNLLGKPETLPEVLYELTVDVSLFERAVGTVEQVKVDRIKLREPLLLNVLTSITLGVVTDVREDHVTVALRRPVCVPRGQRIALSRRIAGRWRLIGHGVIV